MSSLCLSLLGVAVAFALYTYLGYPLLLLLGAALRRRRAVAPLSDWPNISIVLVVYNEEALIGSTLENLLQLDYPTDRRQIIVVSDASADRTEAIVGEYAGRGVQLLRMPRRVGKTAAENAALPLLRGEIIVNTDASVHVERGALKPLMASFVDPTVGVASSHYVSVARIEEHANYGESWYVGYDMWVGHLESRVSGIVGAAGCLYAVRAPIQMHVLPEGLSRDFAAVLLARELGLRAVSVRDAVCFVARLPSLRQEYRRKVRTITRGWHTLSFKRQLLNPFGSGPGVFSWILTSRKICRWLMPHVGVLALAALVCLVPSTRWAGWGVGLAAIAGLCAALGWWWPEGRPLPKLCAVPAYVVIGNLAALHASIRAARGERTPIWEPTRRDGGRPAARSREGTSSDVARSGRDVLVVVSVDTEEDNWVATRSGITVENIREVRRLQRFFDGLGVRPTYFTTYQVATQPWAADIVREACAHGRAEIGAHLHPWNTPPIELPLTPRITMMKNLPPELQLEKLRRLTGTLGDTFGARPTAFRAGRFGLGAGGVSALLACGYETDSSVTPFVSWEAVDDGPTFVGAPLNAYRIAEGQDVRVPVPGGSLVEIPFTCGYTRWSSSHWPLVQRVLSAPLGRAIRVPGILARLGVVKLTMLSPEFESVRDLLALSRGALDGGVRHLHLSFHSVVLRPGLSPWTTSAAGVDRVFATIAGYLEGLSKMASVRFATVTEARIALVSGDAHIDRPVRQRVVHA